MLQTSPVFGDVDANLAKIEEAIGGPGANIDLVVLPELCTTGYQFRDRAPARFRPPGRCPSCRAQRIDGPHLWIESRSADGSKRAGSKRERP